MTTRVSLVLAVLVAAGCVRSADDGTAVDESAILNGSTFADTVGYPQVVTDAPGFGGCSGVTLSPQWVLTAGHCFVTYGIVGMATAVTVSLGAQSKTSTEFYIHPNWWRPGENNPNLMFDHAFDEALIHLPTPLDPGTTYRNNFMNVTANRWFNAGEVYTCNGYGSNTAGPDGGVGSGSGVLRTGQMTMLRYDCSLLGVINKQCSTDMIALGTRNGQNIWHGDSGGGCYASAGHRNVISGIASLIYNNSGVWEGWVVDPWWITMFIDDVVHSPVTTYGMAPPASTPPPWITAGGSSGRDYILATYTNGNGLQASVRAGTFVYNFTNLSTSGLPAGSVRSAVGIRDTGSSVLFAVVASDGQMYVANPTLSTPPSGSWGTFPWSAAGSPSGGFAPGQPAIVNTSGLNRIDYFARGADNKIWTRWKMNGSWGGSWTQLPGGLTFSGSPSVTMHGANYVLVAVASDGSGQLTQLRSPSPTAYSANGTPWTAWMLLYNGYFNSSLAVASSNPSFSLNRPIPVDIYGISNGSLYHSSFDGDYVTPDWTNLGTWSEWMFMNRGSDFTQALPYGPSISGWRDSMAIVTTGAGSSVTPRVIRFPK